MSTSVARLVSVTLCSAFLSSGTVGRPTVPLGTRVNGVTQSGWHLTGRTRVRLIGRGGRWLEDPNDFRFIFHTVAFTTGRKNSATRKIQIAIQAVSFDL